MSAANFQTMRDFSLFTKNYIEEVKHCPECGAIMDADTTECDCCGCDELEEYSCFNELACQEEWDEITALLDDFNRELMFHKVKLQSGYYYGIQFVVEAEHDLTAYNYDNDECHYYFDCCRSVAYRKYAAEVRKISRRMAKLANRYGFEEMVCTARFSNGEALYAPTSNARARLYSAVA